MLLSKQCCTVEQGKRLTELGVNAPSYFIHHVQNVANLIQESWVHIKADAETYPAYTVAELGEMLPDGFTYKGEKSGLRCQHWNKGNDELPYYTCTIYPWDSWISATHVFEGNNEAEARAEAVIFFIEQKLITPEECNERLNH